MSTTVAEDLEQLWWLTCAGFLFFGLVPPTQIGLTAIEAGVCRPSSSETVLVKNAVQLGLGCIAWWVLGFGFAFNNVEDNNFIGNERYAGHEWEEGMHYLMATCYGFVGISVLYIINGAVAERVQLFAHIILAFFIMIFFWPVVVAWGWGSGWLYSMSMEFIDRGGACTVHVFAGTMALAGAIVAGERYGRWSNSENAPVFRFHSPVLFTVGTIFYFISLCFLNAFHAETLYQRGMAIFNTWLAAGTAAGVAVVAGTAANKDMDTHFACILRGFIAGAVSVSSMAIRIEAWEAFVMGIIGGVAFIAGKTILDKKHIDDVAMMVSTHLFPGAVATFWVGLWDEKVGAFHSGSSGAILGTQTAGLMAIFAWALLFGLLLFLILKVTRLLRVPDDLQKIGLNYTLFSVFGHSHEKPLKEAAKQESQPEEAKLNEE